MVIPKELRDRAGLGPGSNVAFEPLEDGIIVRRADRTTPMRGRFARSGMAARLVEDRRQERR